MSDPRPGDTPRTFDPAYLAALDKRAVLIWRELLEPPPPVDFNDWAAEHLIFGAGERYPGNYDPNRFPFFTEVLAALGPEEAARVVTLLGSAQVGKTLLAQIFAAASLDLDPGVVLYIHPTEHNGIRFARTKWRPLIRSCPRLGEIFEQRQSKEGGNSTLFQERIDGRGSLLIGGASSEASLSMITVRRQIQDDLSKWENNNAGDPEAQADSRSKAFEDAKIFKLGTALLKTNCRTTRSFLAGTQEHFHVPCPHCEHYQPLDPDNFIAALDEQQPDAAHFTCVACGSAIREHHRRAIVARGRWVAHNLAGLDRSFTVWAAYAPLESWERIARSYLAAVGDPATEQTWWNDTGGRAYELPGEAPEWTDLKERGDASPRPLGLVPYGALLTTLSLDCQDDFVDGIVVGWGINLTRWVIQRVRVEGHISTPECRAELNRLVDFEWPTTSGTRRKVDLAGIDGGAWTDEVLDWAKTFPKSRLIMLRGVGGDAAPTLAIVRRERRRDGRLVKYQGRFFNCGVNGLKGGLYKFLRITEPGTRGYVDFPAGLDDDYYEQLTAEKRTPKVDRNGFTGYAWVKSRGTRNEQLDVMVYGEALARKLGWRTFSPEHWEHLAKQREIEGVNATATAAHEFWGEPPDHPELPPTPANVPPAAVVAQRAQPRIFRSRFHDRRF
jgi:phage terminase large subunit GpA-like protein